MNKAIKLFYFLAFTLLFISHCSCAAVKWVLTGRGFMQELMDWYLLRNEKQSDKPTP